MNVCGHFDVCLLQTPTASMSNRGQGSVSCSMKHLSTTRRASLTEKVHFVNRLLDLVDKVHGALHARWCLARRRGLQKDGAGYGVWASATPMHLVDGVPDIPPIVRENSAWRISSYPTLLAQDPHADIPQSRAHTSSAHPLERSASRTMLYSCTPRRRRD